MLSDSRFCGQIHQHTVQRVFADLYRALDKSIELEVFEESELGENSCLRTFYVMLQVGFRDEAVWVSIENIYENYFRRNLADNPCENLPVWLDRFNEMAQSLTSLNDHLSGDTANGSYKILINSMGNEFKGFSIRSLALLLQLRCTYPSPPDWHDPLGLLLPRLDSRLADEIDNAITEIERKYLSEWKQNPATHALFTGKANALRNQLQRLRVLNKDISLLDLVKWIELAVWAGNPKGTFRDLWDFVFIQKRAQTARDSAQVFWKDLVHGYRNNHLLNLLTPYYPRGLEFIVKEVKRLRHRINLHGI
jgi:hypothetical protein